MFDFNFAKPLPVIPVSLYKWLLALSFIIVSVVVYYNLYQTRNVGAAKTFVQISFNSKEIISDTAVVDGKAEEGTDKTNCFSLVKELKLLGVLIVNDKIITFIEQLVTGETITVAQEDKSPDVELPQLVKADLSSAHYYWRGCDVFLSFYNKVGTKQ